MNKSEFLAALKEKLEGLPQDVIDSSLEYYSEMIADYIDDGSTEEDAVKVIGTVEQIADQILQDTPLPMLVKEKISLPRSLKTWEIVLIVLGAPLWVPLLLACAAVALTVYFTVWIVVISLYSIDLSLIACAVACLICAVLFLPQQNYAAAMITFGLMLVFVGLSIILFVGCGQAVKGIMLVSKKLVLFLKNLFIRKETAK